MAVLHLPKSFPNSLKRRREMNKEIKVEALARVEGHGGITVTIKDNKVEDVKVNIFEGPRLIETLVIGRTPEESLSITPRICAICTVSHKYAALRGLEKALGIKLPKKAQLVRELMHLGELIESNSLHVFLLALPDFLGYPSVVHMTKDYFEVVKSGLALKKFGNYIMEVTTARATHGENPILGGFGRYPTPEELKDIKKKAEECMPLAEIGIETLRQLRMPTYMEESMVFMALKPFGDGYGLVGDKIMISTGECVDVEEYNSVVEERVVPHSFAKRSRYRGKTFMVGALARINILGERLTGKAGEYFRKCYSLSWMRNPLYNNFAQALEIVYALERIPALVDEILKLKDPKIAKPERNTGTGTGAVEAPRGVLYHHYEIKDGLIEKCDIITPTAQNLDNMEVHVRVGAETLLSKGHKDDDDLKLKLEMVVRAYDPCISCATHLVRIVRA